MEPELMSNPVSNATGQLLNPPVSAIQAVRLSDYAQVTVFLTAVGAGLYGVAQLRNDGTLRAELLLGPIFALVSLTALIWLLMVVVRNAAVLRGLVSPEYYLAYTAKAPPDWIERPARTFNNLMQVPAMFYVVCALMIVTHSVDRSQLAYAWIYVALRLLHACIYIRWNYLPYRFATWAASCVTLGVIWVRFASQAWPGF
jgi:hypothetical protein